MSWGVWKLLPWGRAYGLHFDFSRPFQGKKIPPSCAVAKRSSPIKVRNAMQSNKLGQVKKQTIAMAPDTPSGVLKAYPKAFFVHAQVGVT
jgi:hypothetical protein